MPPVSAGAAELGWVRGLGLRDLDTEIGALADAVGAPGERSIAQQLDTIERALSALAPAQGLGPDTAS
ncbi:hypothetical protein [Streptomyces platensis]|uniref:hypothetical protein n=1 Tax=Streptomyces platensis TaxID=58346 RepID=UPI001F2928A3|nr:hypothetical protein [Streptomyces platensis]MCF3143796.1 hypothetical protein [Streptomyces platensis]